MELEQRRLSGLLHFGYFNVLKGKYVYFGKEKVYFGRMPLAWQGSNVLP